MTIDIEDLRAKLDAATPGPWSVNITPTARHSAEFRAPGPWNGFLLAAAHTNNADLNLIVAAVNALPALLDELERLRAATSDVEEESAHLRARIEEAREAWWSATEHGDNGLIYTDMIEDAMDDIWSAIGHTDWTPEAARQAGGTPA